MLVVGGGIIGAAAALDAAGRGLSVALIEQHDFASGTSSKSTKLLHGGIRYLPHFQFGLIREGLLEQKILARTADYLFRSLEFAVPLFKRRGMADLPRWASVPALLPYSLRIGLSFYDLLGRRSSLERHRKLSREQLLQMLPTLRTEGLRPGFAYCDAQTDDARLTISVLKTAIQRYEAVAVSRVKAQSVEHGGHGYRVMLQDTGTGSDFDVDTRSVIAATWAFRPPPLHGGADTPAFQLSKGAHLLYRAKDLKIGSTGVVLPETDDGRVLFVVPWHDMALLGTTDTPFDGNPADVYADDGDIDYLHRHLHQYLDIPDVEPIASFAGLRALIDTGGSTAKASRGHKMVQAGSGYTQVLGGKLTAYRPIAAEAVDTLMSHLGTSAKSLTATEGLVGAGVSDELTRRVARALAEFDVSPDYPQGLIDRYGTEAERVVELLVAQPELRVRLGNGDTTLAEVTYTTRYESVASIADFALRRTHLAWGIRDRARGDAAIIGRTIGAELGWSDTDVESAVADYEEALRLEGL